MVGLRESGRTDAELFGIRIRCDGKIELFPICLSVDQEGVIIGDDYKREVLSLRLQSDVASWLQVGTQMGYTFNDYSGPIDLQFGTGLAFDSLWPSDSSER